MVTSIEPLILIGYIREVKISPPWLYGVLLPWYSYHWKESYHLMVGFMQQGPDARETLTLIPKQSTTKKNNNNE